MAIQKPQPWGEIESDDRFQQLAPDVRLQVFNNWTNKVKEYGNSFGGFIDEVPRTNFENFVTQKSTELSSQIPKEVGTLQGIVNAAANAWDSSQQALKVTGGVTPEEAQEISKLEYNKQARSLAPGYRAYQEAEGWDAVKAFATNPIEVTTNIVAEGLAGSVPALAAGTATGLAGAGVGSVVPGIGTAAGFTAGQVTGTFAGSLATEYGSKILSELQEAGMDLKDPNSIVNFFSNEQLVNAARTKGLEKGIPVSLFDAVTAGIGGRVSSIVKAAAKAPEGALLKRAVETGAVQALTKTPTRIAATELGIQAAGGGLGEVAGAVVAGEPIEPKAVFAEVIGEAGPGAIEIAQGRLASRKAEAKAVEDKKISETLKVEKTLQENNAPLTAQAVRDVTVKSMKEDSDAERLREFTLQGEQVPVVKKTEGAVAAAPAPAPAPAAVPPAPAAAAPAQPVVTVAPEYQPEALQKLSEEQLLAEGTRLANLVTEAQRISPQAAAPLQAALDNARAEYRRRKQATPPAGTPAGTVSFVQGQEGQGAVAPAAAPVVAAPPAAAAPPPSPALVRTPEQIEQAREATFGLPKENTFRKFVEDRMGLNSAVGVLKLLADNNVIPQGTQSLSEVQNPEQVMGWLTENKFDQMGRKTLPTFLMEKRQRGEALTPFTPAAGMPLFQAAEGAAPAPAAPAPTGLQALTEDELDQEETIQQQKSETATDEVQLAEANQALQQINAERTRRAQPPAPSVAETGAAPAVTEPAAATTDEAFNKAQQRLARLEELKTEREQIRSQMRGKLGQASMGADPELAFLAVKLAVNYAKEGIIRFSDWSARVQQDFPDIWDGIKDYLQEAWNTARAQVPELRPLEERTAALPLAPAPTGERPQVTITPAVPTEIESKTIDSTRGFSTGLQKAFDITESLAKNLSGVYDTYVADKDVLRSGVVFTKTKTNQLSGFSLEDIRRAISKATNAATDNVEGLTTLINRGVKIKPLELVPGQTTVNINVPVEVVSIKEDPAVPVGQFKFDDVTKRSTPTPTTEPTLPLAPAPEGERPQVQITPPQRTEGVMPGGLIEYRQNLVKEARDAGVRTIRRSFEEIEADMKGKGWNGRKSLKNFVREVMDQANKDLQQGVAAPTQVIPDSKEEASLYEQARKTQAVPSMGTVIKRLYNYIGRTKKQLKEARTQIRPDKETSGLIVTLKSIQRNAQTQLANDLGITNPETIEFTSDLDGELRIPNRISTTVTSPGSLTNAADLVVESPDPNATQEEIEDAIYSNRTKVRAYLATLPNGSYEIKDDVGDVVGTLVIERPEAAAPAITSEKVVKNLPKIQSLIEKKDEIDAKIRETRQRLLSLRERETSPTVIGELGLRWAGSKVITSKGESGVVVAGSFPLPPRSLAVGEKNLGVLVQFSKKDSRVIPVSELTVTEYGNKPMQGAPGEGRPGVVIKTKEIQELLGSLQKESANLESRLNTLIDRTRQRVMEFALTASSPDPNPELLVAPPSTEGELSDYARFIEPDGAEGILFDAIEYLSGNITVSSEDVFVNDSEITARQLDQGRKLVVPEDMRQRVAPGITFDPNTGEVTSAVSAINGGTRVTASGQLMDAAIEAQTVMDTNFKPLREELIEIADVIDGIVRNEEGEVVSRQKPLTREQVKLIEAADQFFQTWQVGANVDEARVAQIARILYAESFRKGGRNVTPRRAFSRAIQKLLDRQRYRPQVVSLDAPFKDGFKVYGDKPSISTMLEDFEGVMPADEAVEEPSFGVVDLKPKRTAKDKGGDNFRNMLDYDELVYRQTTLRHARLIAADPELNRGSEVYLKQHAREMLTLRRKLAKDGKLKGFSQEEISNFTMSVLRDLDKNPLASTAAFEKGASKNHYSADPDSVGPSENPATAEESGRALRLVKEVISKYYPGIREVIITDDRGRMHVNSALSRTLFVNPQRLAETIRNMDDDQAAAFIRASGMHEYFHLGLLRKIGLDGLTKIATGLTDAQLDQTADLYFSQTVFETEAQRAEAYDKFKADRVGAAMEFITMLAERMKRGESVQEMPEIAGMPKNLLQRILAAIKTVWRRFETHVIAMRNPALREQLSNLRDGVRELDTITYGESVYPESYVELREAPAEYANLVGRIFESYKGDGRKLYRVSIPGNKPAETLAVNADAAYGNVISNIIRYSKTKSIRFGNKSFTNIGQAIAAIKAEFPVEKAVKLAVTKNEINLAQATGETPADGGPVQGTFNFYSYSPDTRVRVGMVGPEKGGFWSNIKAMFTGRYSETRAKVGGLGSSGKFTPEQRDIRLRQAAKINAIVAKAEFLVKKYQRVLKNLYKKDSEIPSDIINTALGSTENKYTDDQYNQLQRAADEETRAALVRKFMEENIATAEAKIADAQAQLPEELVSVIRDMRDTITDLSDRLLAGGYISEKLKPVVEANRNVYLHRSYLIFDNPMWKNLMENPEPGSEHERIVNAADRLFRLKAQADIARDLRNTAAKAGREISVRASLRIASRLKDDIAIKAHNMMVDYLSIAEDRETNYLLTGVLPGQFRSDIIKERGQIPKEIRELWGQIENNETNFTKTVAKMAAFMATTDTARDLLDAGIKAGYIWKAGRSTGEIPPAGYRPIYPAGTVGDYNPLKDAYAPKEVRDAFRSLRDVNTMEGWAKWFSGLTAWSMASKTIGNFPQGYVRNFLGNPLLIINGGFIEPGQLLNPMQLLRTAKLAFRAAVANTGLSLDEAIQQKRNEYISEGVIGDNVESGLFKEMIQASMDEPGIPSLWKDTKAQKAFKQRAKNSVGTLRNFFEKMANIYQGIDDFWKVFAYEQEKKFQRRTHPDWSESQIQKEAASRVRNKLPTYSLSPEITRSIRRTPFIAPFITWTSEVIRTGANTIAIAREDIRLGRENNNKQQVSDGIRALLGTLASAAIIPGAVAASKAIFGYDEEDDEAVRQFAPEYEKNDQLLYIGQRENGKASYINLSYLDPQQMRAEVAIAFYRALRGDEGVGEAFIDAASQMLQPILSEQLFAGAVMDLARNRTAQGGTIWNEQDTPTNITLAKLAHLGKALAPGVITGAGTRIYRAATGQVTKQARSYDLSNELFGVAFGQRVAEVDAQTDLGNKAKAFLANRSDATRLLTSILNSRGTVDINDIPVAYDNASTAFQELYEDMHKAYLSALRLGVPKAQAIRIIGGEGKERGLSERDLTAIVTGKFPKFMVSPITLDMTLTTAPTREEGIARRQAYLQAVRERNAKNQ